MSHLQKVKNLFRRACQILKGEKLTFRPMQGRRKPVNIVRRQDGNYQDVNWRSLNQKRSILVSHILGYTNLKKKMITIDIWTPRRRQPKSYNALLRIMAHEMAHHEKPPYRQRYKGRLIMRRHYPEFYKQVNKNIEVFKRDKVLGRYFNESINQRSMIKDQ